MLFPVLVDKWMAEVYTNAQIETLLYARCKSQKGK
jgi:hypothetical protein